MNIDGRKMRTIGEFIRRKLNERLGFVLLVFPYHKGCIANYYMSTGQRVDVVKFLRETADQLEQGKVFPTPEDN